MLRRSLRLASRQRTAAQNVRAPMFHIGENVHGFKVHNIRSIDDLHLVTYELTHERTNAKYYHIETDDTNNTFCVGFRTPAQNDKGTSHVLEHTVLCGSEKHPIRDPFFLMLRRSLSTYMNAMTGADYTLYPFSTVNTQDFRNLLSVYLDAVFRPLLREEDFRQEGHRVELKETDSDNSSSSKMVLTHNGVVFNEMRGVVCEPNNYFYRTVLKTMLPNTHYVFNSGGHPPNILLLTHKELVEFHRRHYSPGNSITFTYGCHNPKTHTLKALDDYFSQFSLSEPVEIPTLSDNSRFDSPQLVKVDGPLDAMGNPDYQKRVAVAYGIPQNQNALKDVVAHSVLDDLLSDGPSSPMYHTLIESQLGSRYAPAKGYAFYLSSPIISYGVSGVDIKRENAEQDVKKAVVSALEKVKQEGFDPRRVRSVVFQQELNQRHRSSSFGLNLCTGLCALSLCRKGTDPLDYINWLPHLKEIEKDNGSSLIPLVEQNLLSNSHQAVISVTPKAEFLENFRLHFQKLEDELNDKTTSEEKDKIKDDTAEWLKRVRAPQNTDVLPTLQVSDISRESFREPLSQESTACRFIYTIPYPTNGLVYVHGLVPYEPSIYEAISRMDLAAVPMNFPLLLTLLGHTGAGRHSFRDFSVESELICGGFSFSLVLNESYRCKDTIVTGIKLGFYTTKEKLEEALQLLHLLLVNPRTSLDDQEVMNQVLSLSKMSCSRGIQSLQSSGHVLAVSAACSRLSPIGAISERWWGLERTKWDAALLDQLQGEKSTQQNTLHELGEHYQKFVSALASGMGKCLLWATCESHHQSDVEQALCSFRNKFPSENQANTEKAMRLALDSTTWTTVASPSQRECRECLPIDTSFVGLAIKNDLTWSHPEQAPLRVACQLLANEYIHRRVREEGGAYGANARASLNGDVGGVTMSSYRDPTPEKTIVAFDESQEWLGNIANITQERLREAKLRLFSHIDRPYTADSFGSMLYLHDIDHQLKQQMRDALLSVTADQVVDAAKHLNTSKAAISVLMPQKDGTEEEKGE